MLVIKSSFADDKLTLPILETTIPNITNPVFAAIAETIFALLLLGFIRNIVWKSLNFRGEQL